MQLEELLMNWVHLCHQHQEHVPQGYYCKSGSGNPWGSSGEPHFMFSMLVYLRMELLSLRAQMWFSFYLPYFEISCLLNI